MSDDEDYVYDEASGEWLSASAARDRAAAAAAGPEVRDAVGNLPADGDAVVPVNDLTDHGAGTTLNVGTVSKAIRLPGYVQETDCSPEGIQVLDLRGTFMRTDATHG